eukprot:scaffold1244_cov162-Ochromonas_danica.AAC.53
MTTASQALFFFMMITSCYGFVRHAGLLRHTRSAFRASRFSSSFALDVNVQNPPQFSQKPSLSHDSEGRFNGVTIVTDREHARKVLSVLNRHPEAIWACDTEVADIDVSAQSPVGNGKVICVSIYGGDEIDFGSGSSLWIDNAGDAEGVLQEFKEWFESPDYKKVWHNYGFDRHVMQNEGIKCGGFAGDTMHMARLWDTSRDKATGGGDGYSLASLTSTFFKDTDPRFVKISMKDLFGKAKLRKDGTESKIKELPHLLELQQDQATRSEWIQYSVRDAVATWCVMKELHKQLRMMPWVVDNRTLGNMLDFYMSYLRPFGELLTDMEANGIRVDTTGHLKLAEAKARDERDRMERIFMEWAGNFTDNIKYINIASTAQMQQLLFGHYEDKKLISLERSFKVDMSEEEILAAEAALIRINPYAMKSISELKEIIKSRGLKTSGTKGEITQRLIDYDERVIALKAYSFDELLEMCTARGIEVGDDSQETLVEKYMASEAAASKKTSKKAKIPSGEELGVNPVNTTLITGAVTQQSVTSSVKKYREITIRSVGLTPSTFTPTGLPQVSASLLKKLAGKNVFGEESEAKWGEAYDFFGGGEAGAKACRAIAALAASLVDKQGRIHCSLNLNTETGRLSSRRPNLQNQPALEKDQYKIRDAFIAEEGKTFIVADYGQLELRVLAHVTRCASMIEAFAKGGCFHSRTAMGMFGYIREAVDSGKVMLEWDYSKGQPTVPLVKDTFASERRKAKTLNFSIAYGKTVHGLAEDWGISKEEAQETLDAWYRDRPEVKEWQQRTQQMAKRGGYVRTMMGRYRRLPDANGLGPSAGHALRAAINTPIQGSAADIVMMAMIKLWSSEKLKNLGWKLLLQIHDEVILEGPKETRDEAMKEVRECMENPFDHFGLPPLLVHLDVDAKSEDSWYKAK